MTINLNDNQLIKQYISGDEKAFEHLVERYIRIIYNFSYKNVGSGPEAEDITQEVFIKVWKNIRKFDLKKDFKPWLFQIAKNTAIDYLRKKKSVPFSRFENEKGQNVLLDNLRGAPQNILENISDRRVLATAMQNLNTNEQKMIILRHNNGMSFKEIAEVLEESINTVKSRYRRILAGLKKNIQTRF